MQLEEFQRQSRATELIKKDKEQVLQTHEQFKEQSQNDKKLLKQEIDQLLVNSKILKVEKESLQKDMEHLTEANQKL